MNIESVPVCNLPVCPTGILKPSPSTLTQSQTQAQRSAQPYRSRQSAAQTVQCCRSSGGSGLDYCLDFSACATPCMNPR